MIRSIPFDASPALSGSRGRCSCVSAPRAFVSHASASRAVQAAWFTFDALLAAALLVLAQRWRSGLGRLLTTLEIPEATVRTRFFRARSLLREGLSRDVDFAIGDAFSFAGARCDRIVANVLTRLTEDRESSRS